MSFDETNAPPRGATPGHDASEGRRLTSNGTRRHLKNRPVGLSAQRHSPVVSGHDDPAHLTSPRMDTHPPHTIVVVSHTHWDREWYHPLGRMRQRLARLIDELLDAPDGLPFLLDGQAIVLDDYRTLRPGRAAALRDALRNGQLEAGPWYVLADMLMPGGEALVRNLLEGVRTVREAGGNPPDVLYSPDAFGHSGAGPLLAEGFGLRVAVVWRGYGGPSFPASTVATWTHASGASVLLYHLPPDGYEIGSSLPVARPDAMLRWTTMRDAVLAGNPSRVSLLPNGADHHARQSQRADAIAALSIAAEPHVVICDTLQGFAQRLSASASDIELPMVNGELRDSAGWTWSLQGTFSTRAHQKRTNAQLERLFVRDAEPWLALAWFTRGYNEPSLRTAWKTLLATHPHDTLCGCSVDEVALDAEQRWSDARTQAIGLRDDALRALQQLDASVERDRETQWTPTLVIRNPAARARGGAVRIRLLDAVVADPVGLGSASARTIHAESPASDAEWTGHQHLQVVGSARDFDRVESPLHYPRNADVRATDAIAWIPPMPGYAVHSVRLAVLHALVEPVPDYHRIAATSEALAGAVWRISSTAAGVVALHTATGAELAPLGCLESVADAGDTYTPSLHGEPILADWSAPRLNASGPLRAEWAFQASLDRPRNSAARATAPDSRAAPPGDLVTVSATASLALTAGQEWIELTIRGENPAGDHRLRWVLPLPDGIDASRIVADAAFGAVERFAAPRDSTDWSAERRLSTAPLHRWLYIAGQTRGLGIVSDGLAEYELLPTGHLAITLLRAVGELSRRDLPERPGHAGWPQATPLAQSRGPFEARVALLILPANREQAIVQIECAADDFLLPVTGDTWRGVSTELPDFTGLTLEGDGLTFSAAKRSENGEWLVLRCLNQRAVSMRGAWLLPSPATEVRLSRLDETPGDPLNERGIRIHFTAPAHAVVTLLIK